MADFNPLLGRSASDFMSSLRLSAYWAYAEGDFSNLCFSQGRTIIDRAKRAVGLPAGGAWDSALQARLLDVVNSLLRTDGAWQTVSSALQADMSLADGASLSEMSTRFALWVAFYRTSNRRFDSIQFIEGTQLPQWNVDLPATRSTVQIVCYDPRIDADPTVVEPSELSLAVARSLTGVRLEAGRPAPSSSTATIFSQKPAVPTWAVIVVSLLVVAGAVALTTKQGKQPSRRQR
jgi:hypothetical protein